MSCSFVLGTGFRVSVCDVRAGPYAINGVPLRRVNQAYVIATSTKIDISGVQVPATINDAYFAKAKKAATKKTEQEFFEEGKVPYRPHSPLRLVWFGSSGNVPVCREDGSDWAGFADDLVFVCLFVCVFFHPIRRRRPSMPSARLTRRPSTRL